MDEKPTTREAVLALPVLPRDQFVFRRWGGQETIFDVKDDDGAMWKVVKGRDGNWYRDQGLLGLYGI